MLHDAEGWPASEVAQVLDVGTRRPTSASSARTRLISAVADPVSPTLTPPAFACRDARAHAHDLLEGTLEGTARVCPEYVLGHRRGLLVRQRSSTNDGMDNNLPAPDGPFSLCSQSLK